MGKQGVGKDFLDLSFTFSFYLYLERHFLRRVFDSSRYHPLLKLTLPSLSFIVFDPTPNFRKYLIAEASFVLGHTLRPLDFLWLKKAVSLSRI
jgi:hypothetical protein